MLAKPNTPPAASIAKLYRSERLEYAHWVKYKLGMVIKKPILVLTVMAVARYSGIAF